MSPIRVQLVGDHQMLADALSDRLAREPHEFVVHQRSSVDVRLGAPAGADGPAVTLVDARSIAGSWTVLVDVIVEAAPDTRVAVLSGTADVEDATTAARRCLAAWLPPDVTADRVVEVLRDVAAGHTVYPSALLGAVFRRLADDRGDRPVAAGPLAALTEREHDVLRHLVDGRRDAEIAERLEMAATTVRTHTGRILRKLRVHSRLEAVRIARMHGVTTSPPGPRKVVNPSTATDAPGRCRARTSALGSVT